MQLRLNRPCTVRVYSELKVPARLVRAGFRTNGGPAVLAPPSVLVTPAAPGIVLPKPAVNAPTGTKGGHHKVPLTIEDVDNGRTVGFGADLADDHPGFHDEAYKKRRVMIADIARKHKVGEPIPRVEYTPEEVEVWGTALSKLKELYPKHACRQVNEGLPKLGFREDEVPQLQDISDTLKAATGWQVRPTAGLMHPRQFLAGFAFKYFHSTQYMRHASKPMYTPEPDVVHELMGHVAMLADPTFADIVHSIGEASLGADDETIKHLTKVFWYTVEFGVVREGGEHKASGAAILSSFGELENFAKGGAELVPLDINSKLPKMIHKGGYQPRYLVMDSFEDGLRQLREYAFSLKRQSKAA